jgi:hypothetical protein
VSQKFNSAWLEKQRLKRPESIIARPSNVALEKDLHALILSYCRDNRIYVVHSRMDKRATNNTGTTDFILAMPQGRTLWIEAKRKGGKLSPEQTITRHVLRALGHQHYVVWNYADFVSIVKAQTA